MELGAKFEVATSSQSISIRDLVVDKKYPIVSAKKITTKFGPSTLLTLQDSDSAATLLIFMPKRYSEVNSEDDIMKINNNLVVIESYF